MKGVWRTWIETEKDEEERVNRKERKRYRSERKSRTEKGKDRILRKPRRGYEKGGNKGRGVVMEREQEFEKKFVFWNVARIGNKDKEFWRYIKRFEFISLNETWIGEKSWEIWRKRLPKSHE